VKNARSLGRRWNAVRTAEDENHEDANVTKNSRQVGSPNPLKEFGRSVVETIVPVEAGVERPGIDEQWRRLDPTHRHSGALIRAEFVPIGVLSEVLVDVQRDI
jgi:hypothetical protein